jgi:hypothetical protein
MGIATGRWAFYRGIIAGHPQNWQPAERVTKLNGKEQPDSTFLATRGYLMAKAKRGVKSAAIRDYLAANPGARTVDVVAALKKQRIRVSSQMVSTLKGKVGRGHVKKRTTAKNSSSPSIDDLIAAKKLADQLGGVEMARAAIAMLAKLL